MTPQDFIKTENIIKIGPSETLSSALSKLGTAHDAAFVFSQEYKNELLGVISPYYCLIKSSYPGNAKVEHCLFHPPKIKFDYPIQKVAQLLIESKVHYLPVYNDQDNFMGIMSARRLLTKFADSILFKIKIGRILEEKNRQLITVFEDDNISTALNIFKKTKVSKLIVVGHDSKLKGILSYYDLIHYLISPKSSAHKGEREGNKVNFYHLKVKNFAKTYVLTLSQEDELAKALHLILDKKIGSVVVVNKTKYPTGIITTRDLLRLLIKKINGQKFEVLSRNLSTKSRHIVDGFFYHFSNVLRKIPHLARAKLFVKEEKRGGLFEVILSLIPQKGNPKVIKKEGKNLTHVLQKIHLKND